MIGFFPMLFLLFLGLQLAGLIAWPWILVFAPLWVPFICILTMLVTMFVIAIYTMEPKNAKA